MKNIMSILLTAMVLVAVPACGGSKKKDQTKTVKEEVTLNNASDTISIEHVEQAPTEEAKEAANSKF